jgi:hypothetical protein
LGRAIFVVIGITAGGIGIAGMIILTRREIALPT